MYSASRVANDRMSGCCSGCSNNTAIRDGM
jgi:hypothetical protein